MASAVGGLLSLVDHGETGFLIPDRDPVLFAKAIARSSTTRCWPVDVGRPRRPEPRRYTWGFAAARLRRLYADLTVRQLVLGDDAE